MIRALWPLLWIIPATHMANRLIALLISASLWQTAWGQPIVGRDSTHITFLQPSYESPFRWKGAQKGGRWDPHAALLIPLRLSPSAQPVYMQLDTGSPVSMLYSDPDQGRYPADTAHNRASFRVQLGAGLLILERPLIRKIPTPHVGGPPEPLIIGTLGTDFLTQKVVRLDYRRQTIALLDKLPDALEKDTRWSTCLYERGNILLSALVESQSKLLYWDTGSSGFDLLTDQATWSRLAAKDSLPTTYTVPSWNKTLLAHTVAARASIELASQQLPLAYVTYMEGASANQINQMMALGIGGMTGNTLFLKSILLLDLSHRRYSLISSTVIR